MDEAEHADRVFVMEEGRLTFTGTPETLFADKSLVDRSGLELPVLYDVIDRLKKGGIEIPTDIKDEKALAEAIWRLK